MRVEQPKNNRTEKKDSLKVKTEKSVFTQTSDKSANITKTPTTGAFAKILEEAREYHTKKKEEILKDSSTETVAQTDNPEEEKDLDFHTERKEKSEEKNSENDGEQPGDDGSNHLSANILLSEKQLSEPNAPAARAILHVTDLERIIAYVRTQNLKERQEVFISLKNSVLKGLEIKLVLTENGNLSAQFMAKNESVKKQLKKRERELLEILKQRSSKFSEVSILTV